jgi:hypothetical protein
MSLIPRNIFMVSLFFIVALLVLALANYFLYFSSVRFFSVKTSGVKFGLLGLSIFLTLCFILASILTRSFHNPFFNWFYLLSGLWIGLATTLIAFFAIAWAILGAGRLANISISPGILGGLVLILAVAFSGFGVWNAYHPRVKNISVKIKNLPEAWQGKKVVRISDVHLGHVLSKDFFEGVVKQINAVQPDAVFITGDLFDGMGDGFQYVADDINKIQAPKGVYFVTGNHETYFGLDKVYGFLEKSRAKIFHNDMIVVDGLQIIGINYPERLIVLDLEKTIKDIDGFDSQKPSILLHHTPYNVVKAKEAGINLELCGHTHAGQLFPIQFIPRLIYGRFFKGLHTDGDFSIYTSVGTGVWGPTMRTSAVPEIAVITLH